MAARGPTCSPAARETTRSTAAPGTTSSTAATGTTSSTATRGPTCSPAARGMTLSIITIRMRRWSLTLGPAMRPAATPRAMSLVRWRTSSVPPTTTGWKATPTTTGWRAARGPTCSPATRGLTLSLTRFRMRRWSLTLGAAMRPVATPRAMSLVRWRTSSVPTTTTGWKATTTITR